jgi:hypothetical protein
MSSEPRLVVVLDNLLLVEQMVGLAKQVYKTPA